MSNSKATTSTEFKPRGAVFFFGLLVLLGAILWFSFYFLMISKSY